MARLALLRLMSALLATLPAAVAIAQVPIVTDSRIKTLVYNPNEVYTVTTHYGYQSNIEFGLKEVIETVSVGDRVAWQIIPAGRRLFIRAQEENAATNMTVVTNLRAYQFDLRSSSADAVFGSEELTYVVRFFYPDEMAGAPAHYTPAPVAHMAPPPIPVAPAPIAAAAQPAAASNALNFRYTFSGPGSAAPIKIYDDGRRTYFKFRSTPASRFAMITAGGETLPLVARQTEPGIYAVDAIAQRFALSTSAGQVIVYNESSGA
jgi:type IV secretion system protein VirB9